MQIVWWLWRDDDFGDVENDADDGDYGHVDERHGVRKIFKTSGIPKFVNLTRKSV